MLNEYQSVDALIDGVKGTTGFLSNLLTRKAGLVLMFIVLGVLISKMLLG